MRLTDTGIGIPEAKKEQLFQAFSQVEASDARRYGGTGLGLAISQRLCELMGGTMWVESEVGRGSTFHFTIRAEPAGTEVERPAALAELEGRPILIVEDGAMTRRVLADHLESWGMAPRLAPSATEAGRWLRQGETFAAAVLGFCADDIGIAEEIRRRRLPLVLVRRVSFREPSSPIPRADARILAPVKSAELHAALAAVVRPPPESAPVPEPAPAAPADEAAPAPLSILLAEDNLVNQMVAVAMLASLGYQADVANNGREALAALDRQPYDVVLLDIQMPELDGLETARRIRRRWPGSGRPWLIALTASAVKGDREACLDAGMNDYLTKPVAPEDLKKALRRGAERPPLSAATLPPSR